MKKTILIILLLLIVGAVIYLYRTSPESLNLNNSGDVGMNQDNVEALPTIEADDLKMGGSSYGEDNGIYSFLYPSEYILDESDKLHIRIYKTGPTQTGQTEMYDGAIVVFEVINLSGKSLSDWVDTNISNITADGTSELTEAKKQVTLNEYPGFTYATRGLGEASNYVFQKDSNSDNAVLITTLVSDPGNLGFQDEVDKIISTIEIFK